MMKGSPSAGTATRQGGRIPRTGRSPSSQGSGRITQFYICKQCKGRVKDEERGAHLAADHGHILHERHNPIGMQGHIDQNFTRERKT